MGSKTRVLWSDMNLCQVIGNRVSLNLLNMNTWLSFELVIGGKSHSDTKKRKVLTIGTKMKSAASFWTMYGQVVGSMQRPDSSTAVIQL